MDTLGAILSFAAIYYWCFPQSFGRLLADVKTGYAKQLAKVVNDLEQQIKDTSHDQ